MNYSKGSYPFEKGLTQTEIAPANLLTAKGGAQ